MGESFIRLSYQIRSAFSNHVMIESPIIMDMHMTLPDFVDHPTPTLVLYHDNCPDGFGAAWAIRRKIGSSAKFKPVHYETSIDPLSLIGEHVLMVDVALGRELTESIHANAASFLLIDHHKSAYDRLSDLPYCHFDMTRSGAGLAWDYAFPDTPRPPLINLVEAGDLYLWDRVPDSRALRQVLDVGGYDFEQWDAFNARLEDPQTRQDIVLEGQAMAKLFQFQVQTFADQATEIWQQGQKGFAVCVPHMFASEVGGVLSSREPGTFGFTWWAAPDGAIRASWRSSHKDTSVNHLAGEFGGGGHPMASGATMTLSDLQDLLNHPSPALHMPARPSARP